MRAIIRKCLWIVLFSCFAPLLFAQQIPALDREVSVHAQQETIAQVLSGIAQKTGLKFSYSPAQIGADRKVTLQVNRKPLRVVLKMLLGENVQYKGKGNFVILTPKPTPDPKEQPQEITISGYVYDEAGNTLAYASVLNRREQMAAVTNKYGYFKLQVPANRFPVDIKVEKARFRDTLVRVQAKQTQVEVVLAGIKPAAVKDTLPHSSLIKTDTLVNVAAKSTDADTSHLLPPAKSWIDRVLLSDETRANIRNVTDTLFSNVQFSLIPQLSTNKLLVGNTVNNASLSLLVGYSKGLKYAGIAGIANVVRGNASYVLAAGVANIVQDTTYGVQAAGVVNINGNKLTGVQAGGVVNINDGDLDGVQVAGTGNVLKGNMHGVQVGGVFNVNSATTQGVQVAGVVNANSGVMWGPQVAGVVNVNMDSVVGVQVAGVANACHTAVQGSQVAGVVNYTGAGGGNTQVAGVVNVSLGDIKGTQVAGVINVAKGEVLGAQVSGVFNSAGHVKGSQIALINMSETCDGVPIGLFSFAKRGYHKLELFGDEAMYTQLAFRTGVTKFHNIFIAGVDLTNRLSGLWNFGYGFGSYYPMAKNWLIGGDVTSQLYLTGNISQQAVQLNSLHIGFEHRFGKYFSLGFGPSFRVMYNYHSTTAVQDVISPWSMHSQTFSDGSSLRIWAGGKLSLKFL